MLILRWAKAMHHIAANITVYIDNQLLVGRSGAQGRYGILYPELDGDFLGLALEEMPKRVGAPFSISKRMPRSLWKISPLLDGQDLPREPDQGAAGRDAETDLRTFQSAALPLHRQ